MSQMTIEQLAIQFGDVVAVLDDFKAFIDSAKTASSKHRYYWTVEGPENKTYLKAVIGGQFMVGFETDQKTKSSELEKMLLTLKKMDFTGVRYVKLRAWATAIPSVV